MWRFWWSEISSYDNHRQAHMTPTARNICTCAFLPPLLLILAFQPIMFHTVVTEGHYMLFSIDKFFKRRRAELFDCGVENDMSKVTHMLVCIVLTPRFCLLVQFALICSFKNVILFGFARDWCHFLSRRLPYASICLSIFFLEFNVCVYPSGLC